MKYKKRIATGAVAFSFLVSGSNVFAATPQDLGIKNVQGVYQRQSRDKGKLEFRKHNKIVGIVSVLTNTGFVMNIKNLKTKTVSSIDVITYNGTIYSENGIDVAVSSLFVGQKVVVVGSLDKATNVIDAETVKIVANKKSL